MTMLDIVLLISLPGLIEMTMLDIALLISLPGLIVFGFLEWQKRLSLERELELVREQALTDSLTGAWNARYFKSALDEEIKRATREGSTIYVVALDLSGFKFVNDSLNHAVGDQVLIKVKNALEKDLRAGDILARMGGDEFVIALLKVDLEAATEITVRLQKSIEQLSLEEDGLGDHRLSFSYGISCFPEDGADSVSLYELADEKEREAKKAAKEATIGKIA